MSTLATRYYRRSRFEKIAQFAFKRCWDARQRRDVKRQMFWLEIWKYVTAGRWGDPDGWRSPMYLKKEV